MSAKRAARGGGGGLITVIFTGLIMVAVMGWVTNTVVGTIPSENDNLGVITGINTYGPVIVTIILIGFFVLGVAALLRYLGVV